MSYKVNIIILSLLIIVGVFCTFNITKVMVNHPKITSKYNHVLDKEIYFSIPEELNAIDETDKLRAFYKDGVIVIVFDNDLESQPKFIWNDDIEAIPADGSAIIIEQSIGNLHYIGTVEANK